MFEGMSGSPQIENLDIDGFRIVDRSTSSSVRIINGVRSNSFTVSLSLLAEREGRFKIGPYELTLGQEKILSNSIEVRVTNQPSTHKTPEKIFVKAKLSDREVVSGQQLFYILEVYRPARNFGYSRLSFSLPEFKDMIVEEKQATQGERKQVVNGELYQITEVKLPVFAVKQGTLEIPPGSVSYSIKDPRRRRGLFCNFLGDDFFCLGGGKKKTAYAPALKLRVKDLPSPRPQNFGGLVGSYVLEARVDKEEVAVGENLTLTLACTGIGALQDFKGINPEISEFKVYPDGEGTLEKKRDKEGRLGGVKTFQYALVPQKEGDFVLGPFELVYFSHEKARYLSAKTSPIKVRVLKGVDPITATRPLRSNLSKSVTKEKIRILEKDILPILMDWDAGEGEIRLPKWAWALLFAMVLAGTIGLDARSKVLAHRSRNPIQEAYRNAYEVYLKESETPSERIGNRFTYFLLKKLKQEVREITPQETRKLLADCKLSAELTQSILTLMEEEESLQYSGGSRKGSSGEAPQTWNRLAREVERQL